MTDSAKFANILNESNDLLKQDGQAENPQDRLTMLANAGTASLAPMEDMLRGAEVRGMTIGDSKFEEEYFVNSLPFVMRMRFKNKIFDVLKESGEHYRDTQLNGAGTFTAIERQLYSDKLTNTLDAIERQKSVSKASLSVAEGMTACLKSSTDSILQNWETQSKEAIDFLENRDIFYKIIGLRRKARFEKYSEKFKKNLQEKRDQVQASINMVKNRKQNDINQAKTRVEAKLAVSKNGDADERKDLWDFVRAVVADPTVTTVGGITVADFDVRDQGDFLEALVALGYTEKAADSNTTKSLSKGTDELITGMKDEEDDFDTFLSRKRVGDGTKDAAINVKTALKNCVSPASEKEIDLSTLIADLERTIKSKEPDFVNVVYEGVSYGTPQQKLWKIMCYLSKKEKTGAAAGRDKFIKSLDRTTLQNFLKYLNGVDKNTQLKTNIEDVDAQTADYLNDTLLKLHNLWGGEAAVAGPPPRAAIRPLTSLDLISDGDYPMFQRRIRDFEGTYSRNLREFEALKSKLSSDNQAMYSQRWETIKSFSEELKKLSAEWREKKPLWDEYKRVEKDKTPDDEKLSRKQERAENARRAITGTSKLDIAARAAYKLELDGYEAQWNKILKFGEKKTDGPEKIYTENVESFYLAAMGEKIGNPTLKSDSTDAAALAIRLKKYKESKSDKSNFDDRFRDSLKKDFLDCQEEQIAQNLKDSTQSQWDILQKRPEGEFVEIRYHNMLGGDTLPSAKILDSNTGTPPAPTAPVVSALKIISKTKNGVVLEDTVNNKTLVLSGPTEKKENKWSPNLGIYNHRGANVQSNNVEVMGVVLSINLGA